MENASKALIIAGAILISIVLIGVGVLIVNNANGVIGSGTDSMKKQEIDAFNSQFEPYEGTQKGSNVKTLISSIITNNNYYKDTTEKIVSYNNATDSTALSTERARVNSARTYNVVLTYSADTGLINSITVTEGTTLK